MSTEMVSADPKRLAAYTWTLKADSGSFNYTGASDELVNVLSNLRLQYTDSTGNRPWSNVQREDGQTIMMARNETARVVPDLKGMGLKDALYLCESRNISVTARGSGKVRDQSMDPGTPVLKNKKLILELN